MTYLFELMQKHFRHDRPGTMYYEYSIREVNFSAPYDVEVYRTLVDFTI